MNMSVEQLKERNPWVEVANMYNPDKNCLYDDTNIFVCEKDKKLLGEFNEYIKTTKEIKDEIITTIPAEPWWGNPLTARLIILSLNPGYVPEVNKTLARLLQSNNAIRKALIEYKAKTLRLEADSFLPEPDNLEPISCRDAVNMLGDWYWYKKLKHLKDSVNIDENEFFRRIALMEFHGYSSETSNHSFPWKKQYLDSQRFTKELIWHIAEKKNVCFLIMRSSKKWEDLLNEGNENFFQKKTEEGIIICKENKGMSQAITPNNLELKYKTIVNILENK